MTPYHQRKLLLKRSQIALDGLLNNAVQDVDTQMKNDEFARKVLSELDECFRYEKRGRRPINRDLIAKIQALRDAGLPISMVAAKTGVSKVTAWRYATNGGKHTNKWATK